MAPQLRHGRPFPNLPSALAATSSTPSTGTRDSKKAILEPVCPHHRLPFAFAAQPYLSRANQPWDGTLDCLLAALACAAYAIDLPGITRFVLLFIPSAVFRSLTQLASNLSKQALSATRANSPSAFQEPISATSKV
ncbi:hypothetical protein PTTG_11555, partial [Puccinia triticina 1-1 BBBD Race 1]